MNPARRAIEAVSAAFGVPVSAIMGACRKRRVSDARRAAMKLLHDIGWGFSEIGRGLGLDHTSVIHGLRRAAQMPPAWHETYAKASAIMGDDKPRPWRVVYASPIGPPEKPREDERPAPKPLTHDDVWAAKMSGRRFGSVRVGPAAPYREGLPEGAREL